MKLILDSKNEPVDIHLELTVSRGGSLIAAPAPAIDSCSVTVTCLGGGMFELKMQFSGEGMYWAKYYHGFSDPVPTLSNDPRNNDGGISVGAGEYNNNTLNPVVTVPDGHMVKLAVWLLPFIFQGPEAGAAGPCPSSSGDSSSGIA